MCIVERKKWLNIEIILQFFPNAKFIHTHRNFNDAVIGIYQAMLHEISWTHKIEDIISYISIYNKTIDYFKNKYPEKILDIELSKLSNQKEFETKKILDFCNIKYDHDYLDYDKNNKLFNKTIDNDSDGCSDSGDVDQGSGYGCNDSSDVGRSGGDGAGQTRCYT